MVSLQCQCAHFLSWLWLVPNSNAEQFLDTCSQRVGISSRCTCKNNRSPEWMRNFCFIWGGRCPSQWAKLVSWSNALSPRVISTPASTQNSPVDMANLVSTTLGTVTCLCDLSTFRVGGVIESVLIVNSFVIIMLVRFLEVKKMMGHRTLPPGRSTRPQQWKESMVAWNWPLALISSGASATHCSASIKN